MLKIDGVAGGMGGGTTLAGVNPDNLSNEVTKENQRETGFAQDIRAISVLGLVLRGLVAYWCYTWLG